MTDWPKLALPVQPPLEPMEAALVHELPSGKGWQFEPKWDGFRCIAFRSGAEIVLQSKSGQPLTRYFPEVVASLKQIRAKKFVLDGEILCADFDTLLQRLHPAQSRIDKLAQQTPAHFVVFDLLATATSLLEKPLSERRAQLEKFAAQFPAHAILLSPMTTQAKAALRWRTQIGLDGVMAKRADEPYHAGDRTGMQKVKWTRTADCVVGGFRYASKGHALGSFLLGLYDEKGLLDHVGFCSSFTAQQRAELLPKVEALRGGTGFTGRAPGGPSRWATERSAEWEALRPKLVIEISFDHFSGDRFRHGTRMLRFRSDKAPRQCTFEQLTVPHANKK